MVTVLRSCVYEFILPNQTTAVIDDLGCQAVAVLFGGNGTDSLSTVRYDTFSGKVVTSSSFVAPERLPPLSQGVVPECFAIQAMAWIA